MIRLGILSLVATALLAQTPPAAKPPSASQTPPAAPTAAPAQTTVPAPAPPPAQAPLPAQAPAIHNVYILPMAGGLDQYLAEQLTENHGMQVVTDPKAADSFLTDHLGEPFEEKIAEFHQPADAARNANAAIHPSFRSTTSKGTVFLVDAKSRKVLWSDYEKPGSHDSATLNQVAARIVQKMTGKPK
jgi:hypothetical protein